MIKRLLLLASLLGGCGGSPPSAASQPEISLQLKRCLAREASRHPQYPLYSKYRGEELIGVRYDRGEERERHRVYICEGLLCDKRGRPLDPELNLPEHSRRDGKAIFVIDPQGQLWLSFDPQYGRVHHSTLLAGEPVIAAGEMLINTGEVLSVSNESGHYRPPAASLDVADRILALMGVDTSLMEHYVISSRITRAQRRPRALPISLLDELQKKCEASQKTDEAAR